MRLEDLVERASQFDETLARDIKDYVHGRKYGLVYEASKPEFVHMWNKAIVRGDLVNILPPRGTLEDSKESTADSVYKVIELSGKTAKLRSNENSEIIEANIADLVAIARFDRPIYTGLKEIDRVQNGGNKPFNVVINGENYHALQTLVYAYQESVDFIYIDPPYNNGTSHWKYNNNYVGETDIYRHSKWLTFMEDRLRLAKKLLNPKESVLVVTIDEKEYLRLGLLLEQLFPEARIQMISSVINPAGTKRKNEFSRTDEYIFFVMFGNATLEAESQETVNVPVVWDTLRRSSLAQARGKHGKGACGPNQFYPIYVNDKTKRIESIGDPIPETLSRFKAPQRKGCTAVFPVRPDGTEMNWGMKPETAKEWIKKGYMRIGKYTPDQPQQYVVSYITGGNVEDIEKGVAIIDGYEDDGSVRAYYPEGRDKMPTTNWNRSSHDAQRFGSSIVKGIIGNRQFPYPKSLFAVRDALKFFLNSKKDALIIDFFAGSGTTMHAVNLLNKEDNGSRRCICVTNNEISKEENEAYTKKKLRPGDPEWEAHGIAHYVTWPRIKGAILGKKVDGKDLEGNYGCEVEDYTEFVGEVYDEQTKKKVKRKLYDFTKTPIFPSLVNYKLADGFEENAIFFDIEYLEPSIISADLAFEKIAPILWLCGGCAGKILERERGFSLGDTYAVLFDAKYTKQFLTQVKQSTTIDTVFIVTDASERYRNLCTELPDKRVMQLYESYLRSFEINAIG